MKLNEPTTLKVRLTSVDTGKDVSPVRVMVTGDWHISPIISDRQFEFLETAISHSDPDVIILQGDIIDSPLELQRETSLKKLLNSFKLCARRAPTVLVLGSHDYIAPTKSPRVLKEKSLEKWEKVCKKTGVTLLIDDYCDPLPNFRIFGAFQDEKCCLEEGKNGVLRYHDNVKAFSDYIKNTKFPVLKHGINWFAAHAPLLDEDAIKKLGVFDAASFGHTHGGIVPRGLDEIFEKFDLHFGLISANNTVFPRNVRGTRIVNDGTLIVINPGMTGAQFCAPRIFQNLNFIKAAEVSVIEIK